MKRLGRFARGLSSGRLDFAAAPQKHFLRVLALEIAARQNDPP
jgi:hypothetical protein